MITLSEAIKRVQKRYALFRPDDPSTIIRSFNNVFDSRFKGQKYRDFLSDIKVKRNRIILHVTHPALIQEIEGFRENLIHAINEDLGESYILDIDFKVVPS